MGKDNFFIVSSAIPFAARHHREPAAFLITILNKSYANVAPQPGGPVKLRNLRFFCLFALVPSNLAFAAAPAPISFPKNLEKQLKSFEPSAVVYLPEAGNFLLASDETTKDHLPILFRMDASGKVDRVPVLFSGLDSITDIESMSAEDGYIYILSSQSRNKKGKVLRDRNLLLKGKLTERLEVEQSLELRPLLVAALQASSDPKLAPLRDQFEDSVEIEGSAVRNGRLFVTLKDPQPSVGEGLLLDLGSLSSIFAGSLSPKSIRVVAQLDFGREQKISDFIFRGEEILLSTTGDQGGGALWRYSPGNQQLRELDRFEWQRPEGLALFGESQLMVVFDQNADPALYSIVQLR